MSYMGSLKCLAVMVGDLSDHPSTSLALARPSTVCMHRMTDETPTTLSKQGGPAKRAPLDHCFANLSLAQSKVRVKVEDKLVLSDHYPIILELPSLSPEFMCVKWVKSTKKPKPKTCSPPWTCFSYDFSEWQEGARTWLQQAHDQNIEPKGCLSFHAYRCVSPNAHVTFRRLLSLQKAVIELRLHPRLASQETSIARKLRALALGGLLSLLANPEELRKKVQDMVQTYMRVHHRSAIRH